MADFREELHIVRSKDSQGKPSFFARYDYCHTQTDLADETVKIINWEDNISLGDACKLIVDVCGGSEATMKLNIRAFLEADRFYDADEY